MAESLFSKLIFEIQRYPVKQIVPFFRGESLLHPQFCEFVSKIQRKTKAQVQLATNGALLDEMTARYLLEEEIGFISFSLDADNEETYGKIRQGGNFRQILENVNRFIALRNSMRAQTIIQVSFTEQEANKHEVASFISKWRPRVDRVRIYPRHSEKGQYGRLSDRSLHNETHRTPCRKLFTDMVVYWNGDTALCNHDWDRGIGESMGNAGKADLADIWLGETYKSIREFHLNRQWTNVKPCNHCDHWVSLTMDTGPIGKVVMCR